MPVRRLRIVSSFSQEFLREGIQLAAMWIPRILASVLLLPVRDLCPGNQGTGRRKAHRRLWGPTPGRQRRRHRRGAHHRRRAACRGRDSPRRRGHLDRGNERSPRSLRHARPSEHRRPFRLRALGQDVPAAIPGHHHARGGEAAPPRRSHERPRPGCASRRHPLHQESHRKGRHPRTDALRFRPLPPARALSRNRAPALGSLGVRGRPRQGEKAGRGGGRRHQAHRPGPDDDGRGVRGRRRSSPSTSCRSSPTPTVPRRSAGASPPGSTASSTPGSAPCRSIRRTSSP